MFDVLEAPGASNMGGGGVLGYAMVTPLFYFRRKTISNEEMIYEQVHRDFITLLIEESFVHSFQLYEGEFSLVISILALLYVSKILNVHIEIGIIVRLVFSLVSSTCCFFYYFILISREKISIPDKYVRCF